MTSGNFTVLYDACVLFSAPLRDLLMTLAAENLFKAKWTEDIHDEWIRNLLIRRPDIDPLKLQRIKLLMNLAVPDSLIPRSKYHALISSLKLPDPGDRHVLAAAIASGAELIITFNTKDFPKAVLEKYHLSAKTPDNFVSDLLDLDEYRVRECIYLQQSRLKNPPITLEEMLAKLETCGLKNAARRLK